MAEFAGFGTLTVGDLYDAYNEGICQAYSDDGGLIAMGVEDFEQMVEYRATINAYFEAARTWQQLNDVNADTKTVRLDELNDLVQFAWSTKEYLTEGTDEPIDNAREILLDAVVQDDEDRATQLAKDEED